MATRQNDGERLVSVGNMKIRDLGGNSVGITLDRDGLEELEIVDENGELTGEYYARQSISSDGRVELSINLD